MALTNRWIVLKKWNHNWKQKPIQYALTHSMLLDRHWTFSALPIFGLPTNSFYIDLSLNNTNRRVKQIEEKSRHILHPFTGIHCLSYTELATTNWRGEVQIWDWVKTQGSPTHVHKAWVFWFYTFWWFMMFDFLQAPFVFSLHHIALMIAYRYF